MAADRRLSTIGYKRAVFIGAAQILALLPGISRDGIVTVAGMGRGLTRQDAVRFSFLLSAPVILAAGALKATDLTGPISKGMHGPIILGSVIAGLGAYLSIRFLTRYFSEDKSLNPFGVLLHHRRARQPRVPAAQVTPERVVRHGSANYRATFACVSRSVCRTIIRAGADPARPDRGNREVGVQRPEMAGTSAAC